MERNGKEAGVDCDKDKIEDQEADIFRASAFCDRPNHFIGFGGCVAHSALQRGDAGQHCDLRRTERSGY